MGRYLFFLLLAGISILLPTGVARAVEYGGLGGKPANPDPKNSRTNSIYIFTLASKQSQRDGLRVINNGNEPKTVEIYATDSELASGGSFACTQKADEQKNVGSWITFDNSEVIMAANSEQIINFTVKVPANTDVGEHNGCVVIQEKGKTSASANNGVQLSFRSAIRTIVTVPGKIVKDVQFANLRVDPADAQAKKYILTAELQNNGNVSLDTDVQVSVSTLFNKSVYKNGGIYPLLSQEGPIELNFEYNRPFWGGIYKVTGTAAYNSNPQAPLGSSEVRDTVRNSPTKLLFVAPQPLAWLLYLLMLATLGLVGRISYNRLLKHKRISQSWSGYTVKKGDTIHKLAKRRATSWKAVVEVNKLKPPYELKAGANIKLPKLNKSPRSK